VTYGPATITADASGTVCLNILAAPAGMWKVDVVEQGSGFTDSKVFEGIDLPPVPTTVAAANPLEPAPPPPPPPPPTEPPSPPPTVDPNAPTTTADPAAPTTALPETTTTVESETAITIESTTTPEAPGSVPPRNRPFRLLPWLFERVAGGLAFAPAPAQTTGGSTAGLPPTGTSTTAGGLAFALVGLGSVLLFIARRGGPRHVP
jgi:hypothetical protein